MSQFMVSYGTVGPENVRAFIAPDADTVRSLALSFIGVIPDDLEEYQEQITAWDGHSALAISHMDDDHFLFVAAPVSQDTGAFQDFITQYNADY